MSPPMTEERLTQIERELREDLALHRDSTDPRGCPGPALRLAAKELPVLVEEVRRLRRAMVEIRRHVDGTCGHKRRPDKLGACLTAIRDLTFGELPPLVAGVL